MGFFAPRVVVTRVPELRHGVFAGARKPPRQNPSMHCTKRCSYPRKGSLNTVRHLAGAGVLEKDSTFPDGFEDSVRRVGFRILFVQHVDLDQFDRDFEIYGFS